MSDQTNTTLDRTRGEMSTATVTRPSRRRRLIQAVSASLAVMLGTAVLTGTPASASGFDFHNGYTAKTAVSVACDAATRTINVVGVAASAMAKTAYSSTSYTPGAFDAGQYVTYRVYISVNNGPFALQFSVANWKYIKGVTVLNTINGPVNTFEMTNLNDYQLQPIQGMRGNTYRIAVGFDWWTGVETVASELNINYSQRLYGYPQSPSGCTF